MKVAVFGPGGMLGRHVIKALNDRGHAAMPIHRRMFTLLDTASVRDALGDAEAVINCAGVIPLKNTSIIAMIDVNSKFPHILTEAASPLPVILISTDCVFNGSSKYRYTIDDVPNARDYYGKSKALGEVVASNATVVRTSFIGCDHGVMNLVLSTGLIAKSTGTQMRLNGWKNALWTGSTVYTVAHALIDMLEHGSQGLVHLATEAIVTKYDLLVKLIEHYKLDIVVEPVYYPVQNRGLVPSSGCILKDIDAALAEYECTSVIERPPALVA